MKRFSLFVCLFLLLLLVTAGIPLAAASPTISRVSPSSGPNDGPITLTIYGTGFDNNSTTWMRQCPTKTGGKTWGIVYGSVIGWTATSLTATFDLYGKQVGDYDLFVNTPPLWYPSAQDVCEKTRSFAIYKATGSGSSGTTTTTSTTRTTTAAPEQSGDNSVYFETNPPGATIFLGGDEVGTSTFTYHTYRDGTYDVRVKKSGYVDYEGKVTILQGQRARFYALLTPLSSSGNTTTVSTTSGRTPAITSATGAPKNSTTIKKSTIKVPTPWGTDPPVTEESPVDPSTVLLAAALGIGFVVYRRR